MTIMPNADQFDSWNGDSGQRWVAFAGVAEVLAAHHENDAGVTVDAAFWITTARIDGEGAVGPTASTSSLASRLLPVPVNRPAGRSAG